MTFGGNSKPKFLLVSCNDFWTKFESLTPRSEAVLLEDLTYLKDSGVTTLFDAGNFGLDAEVYTAVKRLDDRGALPLRYFGSYTLFLPQHADRAVSKLSAMREEFGSDKVTMRFGSDNSSDKVIR